MRIVSTTGARSLEHNGITYQPKDGESVFEVPEPVGEQLVRFPHWMREYQADPDAASMSERIRALEAQAAQAPAVSGDTATLLARVAELEAELEAQRAALKPATASAAAAAKKTAAKKTAAGGGDTGA